MKKVLIAALVMVSNGVFANGAIDRYFNNEPMSDVKNYKLISSEAFAETLQKTCDSDDFSQVDKANCGSEIVN